MIARIRLRSERRNFAACLRSFLFESIFDPPIVLDDTQVKLTHVFLKFHGLRNRVIISLSCRQLLTFSHAKDTVLSFLTCSPMGLTSCLLRYWECHSRSPQ